MKGNVRWFNPRKGYGFIYSKEFGGDIFVHVSGIICNGRPKVLHPEDFVEFETEAGVQGPVAITVKVITKELAKGVLKDGNESYSN